MGKFTVLHGMAVLATLAASLSVAFSGGEPAPSPTREASTVMFTVCMPFGGPCYDYTCDADHNCRMVRSQPA